ncbi:histidine kinase [Roseivirga sp. E12]|uniref:sensor histidine kinase n=1 Tax=Roseivirga sp. E12 TaxID=2819237 RepID=UPI001ABBF4C5|nr:histidine kinase [Roseivirga sp. E12]
MESKSPISYWQALLGGLLIVLTLTVESSDYVDGQFLINSNRTILLLINYIIWPLSIQWIYTALVKIDLNYSSFFKTFLPRFLAFVIAQLIVSNAIFSLLKLILIDQSIASSMGGLRAVLPQAITSRIIDLSVIVGVLKVVAGQKRIAAQKLEMSNLQNQLTQTKLDMLQMQLNPHFLFNALHAIHSLIGYDNEKSKKLLLNISRLLRKILELGNQQMIPLNEELEFFKTYLSIEEERFHDRLSTDYNISPESLDCFVPSLLLQPLLENALKHGIALLEDPGRIQLKTFLGDDVLNIELSNSISSENSAEVSMGIGLKNVKNRLQTLFPDNHEFSAQKVEDDFVVKIIIPKHDI